MIHHDSRPYEVAVSDSAKKFQVKIEEMIHSSVQRVQRVIEQVENDVPEDMIVKGYSLRFNGENDTLKIIVSVPKNKPVAYDEASVINETSYTIHKHALNQLSDRVKVKNFRTVVNELSERGAWGKELIAHNLNEIYHHLDGERFLLRQVRGEMRGFLSDQFRRLDSRPLLEAFVTAIRRFNARPVDGFALQTKMNVRAILPYVFEPFPGEIMAFGAQLTDSDFGDSKLSMSGFVLRMWCTNLATTEDVLTQVHLGRRLSDAVQFSDRTMQLDTQAMASAINDVASHVLAPAAVNKYLDLVRKANEEKIEPTQINAWAKKNLTKAETEKAVDKFSSADVVTLPPGQTRWRWSNALSWLANETLDEHRKLELQEFAGCGL
jgi:hypothetical protein